jgi:hypothetical protein
MLTAILTRLARHPRIAPISRIHERDLPHTTATELLSLGLYHRLASLPPPCELLLWYKTVLSALPKPGRRDRAIFSC